MCYLYSEEDFEKHLIKDFEEKMNYIRYLKDESSILYHYYKEDPTVFSVKKIDVEDGNQGVNEFINNKKL